MANFRPMLAPQKLTKQLSDLRYPMLASPKYDGIRCVIRGGKALSRSLKPIPNETIRAALESLGAAAEGLDGELMLPAPATFHDISSAVMKHDEPPPDDWFFVVFDRVPENVSEPFSARLQRAGEIVHERKLLRAHGPWSHVVPCLHERIDDVDALTEYEAVALNTGYEGAMLRSLDGPYKFGRATEREGYLYKLKRFVDGEAEIVDAIELNRNRNEAFKGELGQTKRSTLKAGKVAGDVLGALVVRDIKSGVQFKLGTGFTPKQRAGWWRCRDSLIGRIVCYRSQAHGVKNKPRIGSFKGFRHVRDMDAAA